jgi:putative transposase
MVRSRSDRVSEQLALPLLRRSWGGARAGAGRPAGSGRRSVPHRKRELRFKNQPLHVTMRLLVQPLRSRFLFPTVRDAIGQERQSAARGFRICEFSVQDDHIHLVVEAAAPRTLSHGMRRLTLRIARAVNRLLFRRGAVFADRWHGRLLTRPREVRNALVYVLGNFRKHCVGGCGGRGEWDVFSSAPYFRGFRELAGRAPCECVSGAVPRALVPPDLPPVLAPATWLLREGWRRHGLISLSEQPRVQATRLVTERPRRPRGTPERRRLNRKSERTDADGEGGMC